MDKIVDNLFYVVMAVVLIVACVGLLRATFALIAEHRREQ